MIHSEIPGGRLGTVIGGEISYTHFGMQRIF